MTTRGLDHINLRATRELLEALKDFYCEVVGLVVGERPPFGAFGYWLYAGGRAVVHLSEAAPDEVRGTPAATALDHVAFDCEGGAEVEALLRRRAIPYRRALVPGSDRMQLFVHDPAGTKVELNFGSGGG